MRIYLTDVQSESGEGEVLAVLVIGPNDLSGEETLDCVHLVSHLVDRGWPVAANSSTVAGRLVQRAAVAAGGGFVELRRRNHDPGSKLTRMPNIDISTSSTHERDGSGIR
jgi:hypothetical protein